MLFFAGIFSAVAVECNQLPVSTTEELCGGQERHDVILFLSSLLWTLFYVTCKFSEGIFLIAQSVAHIWQFIQLQIIILAILFNLKLFQKCA